MLDAMAGRSNSQFFKMDATIQGIRRIVESESKRLVIYCGAGTTIDKTGYGWADLITALFPQDDPGETTGIDPEDISILRSTYPPQALASILMGDSKTRWGTQEEAMNHCIANLRALLYSKSSWRSGRLANAVASLAVVGATNGIKVDIVTTNYDCYVEEHLVSRLSHVNRAYDSRGDKVELSFVIEGNEGKVEPIRLYYLHGRVPRSETASEMVVLDELSYAKSRETTAKVLDELLDVDTPLLVVGSSLTDAPLIDALAQQMRKANAKNAKKAKRLPPWVAVLTDDSLPTDDAFDAQRNLRLTNMSRKRTDLLGLNLVSPNFYYQIPQFVREVEYALAQEKKPPGGKAITYIDRSAAWWSQWSRNGAGSDQLALVDRLIKGRKMCEKRISRLAGARGLELPSDELFRLELFVRDAPTTQRRLTHWANSSGTKERVGDRRSFELSRSSRNASVRTYIDGRPGFFGFEDLEEDLVIRAEHHWQSYFSVPIVIHPDAKSLQVGVLTLASNKARATTMIPWGHHPHMSRLVDMMITLGREIFCPHAGVKCTCAPK
jgi:hypothetical protein